jgi:two-component system sensor histidine kinase EvgS
VKYKIVLAEDDAVNMKLFADMLTQNDYAVILTQNGKEAVETVERESPDIVLLDLRMPVMDGFEAVRRLKKSPKTAATPVLALTACVMADDKEQVRKAGFDGLVEKPCRVSELLHAIKTHLK